VKTVKDKATQRKSYRKNRVKRIKYRREYYTENRERILEKNKKPFSLKQDYHQRKANRREQNSNNNML